MASSRKNFISKFIATKFLIVLCSKYFITNGSAENLNCTLKVGDDFYDLRYPAEKDYYVFSEETRFKDFIVKYYLSFCHPLRNAPIQCNDPTSSVCLEQITKNETEGMPQFRKVVDANVGKATSSSLRRSPTGWLEYVFDHGSICEESTNRTFTTNVAFLCSYDQEDNEGPVFMNSGHCFYQFAWATKFACPVKIKAPKLNQCVDKFEGGKEVLNLHDLHSETYYNVTTGDRTYQLNICGDIKTGPCGGKNATVCDVSDPKGPKVVSTNSSMGVKWEEGYFKLQYDIDGIKTENEKDVVIKFLCDRTQHDVAFHVNSENASHIEIGALVSSVCTPEEHKCVLQGKTGHVFDLRPLHKTAGNYEILDLREDHRDAIYHLNLCGPMNAMSHWDCPRGKLGACQTSLDNHSALGLGLLTSDPVINSDDSITVVYTGGDPCKDGKHAMSTRITLFCDPNFWQPNFIEETHTCEYIFEWRTPYACPRNVVKSSDCSVVDPLFGLEYDLTPLRNLKADFQTNDGNADYWLNICGGMEGVYGDIDSSAASVVTMHEGEYVSMGYNSTLIFNDGTLAMDLKHGSPCSKGGGNMNSSIIFLCDHVDSNSTQQGPSIFWTGDECNLSFIWHTKAACPPHTVVDCSVTTPEGWRYDLSGLSQTNMNHVEWNEKDKYVLNVCRSIVHSKVARCAYDAAACLIDGTHHKASVSLGVVNKGPEVIEGELMIKYEGGDVCPTNSSMKLRTEILFECDIKNFFPYPTLIAQQNCTYFFEWKTSLACPQKIERITLGNCSAVDIYRDYKIDLSSLTRDEPYRINSSTGVSMILNVCGPVSESECPGHNGACVKNQKDDKYASAGSSSAELSAMPGALALRYKNGAKCDNGLPATTIISFFCGAKGMAEGPILVYVDSDSCAYFVNWHTELACENRVPCNYLDASNNFIDLSPLIRHRNNYVVNVPAVKSRNQTAVKFHLNVCRPINHVIGVKCPPGASVCGVRINDTATGSIVSTDIAFGAGNQFVPPLSMGKGKAMVLYSLGDACGGDSNGLHYSSKIEFECDITAGPGKPGFKELTADCQNIFTWRTSLVCPRHVPDQDSCSIRHDTGRNNLQLHPLYRKGGYDVEFQGFTFTLNVCGSDCRGAGVCTQEGGDYGQVAQSQFEWQGKYLKLVYYGGDACYTSLTKKRTSVIFFECDESAGFGYPKPNPIMRYVSCKAAFTWRTNVTCSNYKFTTPDTNTTNSSQFITTLSPPTNTTQTTNSSETILTPDASTNAEHKETSSSTSSTTLITTLLVLTSVALIAALVGYLYRRGHLHTALRRLRNMSKGGGHYSSRPNVFLLDDAM